MSDEKLVSLSKSLTDPSSTSAKDFKVAVPAEGKSGGDDSLVKMSTKQESPRDVDGKDFSASTNKGESSDQPTKGSTAYSVDLNTGQLSPNVHTAKK
jgi:hypothetical protein